jgi:cardiolipin hydrolase
MSNDILTLYSEALEDLIFTRAERKTVVQRLEAQQLTAHDRNVLRSKVFDMAREVITPENHAAVVDWLEVATKTFLGKDSGSAHESDSFFSPGSECLSAICSQLKQATSSIKICVFTISDDRISKEIIAAHQRGVSVQIITDDEKLFDKGSDIVRLHEAGLPTKVDKTRAHMHHKFAMFDKTTLLSGSYNWTRSAAQYNHENIHITTDTNAVRSYLKEFERLWREMTPFT